LNFPTIQGNPSSPVSTPPSFPIEPCFCYLFRETACVLDGFPGWDQNPPPPFPTPHVFSGPGFLWLFLHTYVSLCFCVFFSLCRRPPFWRSLSGPSSSCCLPFVLFLMVDWDPLRMSPPPRRRFFFCFPASCALSSFGVPASSVRLTPFIVIFFSRVFQGGTGVSGPRRPTR